MSPVIGTTPRRAVVYARISVSAEESVSIARQVQAAEQYAAARGWQVVGTYTDDGVSATANRPEARAGWRALLAATEPCDAVIIWKVDRLARRITDFWDAAKTLEERGRTLVSIQDNLDLSTTIGQIVGGLLAGFAQMEAEAISARVADARRQLLHDGRLPGGTVPYGWRSIPNPDGAGYVLAQDPERIGHVRGAVEIVQRGGSVYRAAQWLDDVGAPLPAASQANRKRAGWSYNTVERLLRNPILAGMVAYNPGNDSKVRGDAVLRDDNGLPVVYPGVGILSPPAWRAMVQALDDRDSAQSRPKALKAKTSALLSGLVWCGKHDQPVRMHRGTTQGRPGYSCPRCHQTISGQGFEGYVVEEFLRQKGEHVRWTKVEEVVEDGAAVLPEIEHALAELGERLRTTDDEDEADRLAAKMRDLRDLRRRKRDEAPRTVLRYEDAGFFADAWAAASTVEERRAVLDDGLARVLVRKGRPGRGLDTNRLAFEWRLPDQVGPLPVPTDEQLAAGS